MAVRNVRVIGDEILRKKCKEVKFITPRIDMLVKDMIDTMYEMNGVGLAAPQVGVLKRIVVIDVGEGVHVFINPQIIEKDGEQVGEEGCLSVPGKAAIVKRPNHVKVRAYDLKMKEFELEGEELLARAICHECDHLDGILYVDNTEGEVFDVTAQDDEQESEPLQDEL